MNIYTVQRGDTLYGISKQFGVSIDDLISENNLSSNNIVVGSQLIIPTLGSVNNYVVKKGDTLYSISKKNNVSVEELMLLNNLTNTSLTPGQVLNIPAGDSVDSFNYYEVLPGDTLYSIANKYDTTIDSLVNLNNLKSNVLTVGQLLIIPSTSIDQDEFIYEVVKGDTLYSIAKKFDISVSDLININGLSSSSLKVGQKLIIGYGYNNDIEIGSSCYGDNYKEPEFVSYVVKKGDNLYNIAKKYGVSVDSILLLNNLSSANLSIGQVLKIKEVQ